jgi:hypothetical protein
MPVANILDAVHDELPTTVWENPGDPEPHLKPQHRKWIQATVERVLREAGYTHMEDWLSLVLTGSLTTYQYGKESDCDVSVFVDTEHFPEWSRAEMIGLMIQHVDGHKLPGTQYPMQCFVVPPTVHKEDLYKPGLRSGYDLELDRWIEPPDPSRVHDVQREYNDLYIYALEQADKMDRLLRYEPDKAVMLWHQIHQRRRRDQAAGKGDYAGSNVVYKFLANRGLFPAISETSGEYIAKQATTTTCPRCQHPSMNVESGHCVACGYAIPYDGWEILDGWKKPEEWAADQELPHHHPIEQGWGPRRFGGPQARTVAKFVYEPVDNHLVLGEMAKEEGEALHHAALVQKSGLDPRNLAFGQFSPEGYIETFSRPMIRGFGKPDVSEAATDHRLRQALEQGVPGLRYEVTNPLMSKFDIPGPPKITYMGEPPVVNPDASNQPPPEEGVWHF